MRGRHPIGMHVAGATAALCMIVACAGSAPSIASAPAPQTANHSSPTLSAPAPPPEPAPAPAPRPDNAAIYARIRSEAIACYEQGAKAHPTMRDGRVTLNASIDGAGRTTCVIPSQDSGLTHDVETCIASALAKQSFDAAPSAEPWTAVVPIVVRAGVVQLGERVPDWEIGAGPETWNMPDAFQVLESLLPELEGCLRGLERKSGLRTVMIGGRVGPDGRAQCAMASTSGGLPRAVADCSAAVLRNAKFPPPKGGAGLVVVPLTIATK